MRDVAPYVELIDRVAGSDNPRRASILFEHYTAMPSENREAFVLALIGKVCVGACFSLAPGDEAGTPSSADDPRARTEVPPAPPEDQIPF